MTEFNRIETDYFEALQYYDRDPYVFLDLWPGVDFVGHLRLIILGLEGTPYEGGRFIFEIKAFETYPFYPPGVFCHTRIWHPNIDIDKPVPTEDLWKDNVCFDIINPDRIGRVDPDTHASGWTPAKDLTLIIECLKLMIHAYPPFFNADDPLNYEAGYQFNNVLGVFKRKASAWTKKYATGDAWNPGDVVLDDDEDYSDPADADGSDAGYAVSDEERQELGDLVDWDEAEGECVVESSSEIEVGTEPASRSRNTGHEEIIETNEDVEIDWEE